MNRSIKSVALMEFNIHKTVGASSPLKTFRTVLERKGIVTYLIDPYILDTKEFIDTTLASDIVIFQHYDTLSEFMLERFAIVNILGIPLVRNWAGTDALNSISDPQIESWTIKANPFFNLNLTTTHDGIVQELNSLGLACTLSPQLIETWPDNSESSIFVPNSVLAYLPSGREQFYGKDILEELIRKFPEITFTIVANNNHCLAHYENVKSLGWVKNFDDIWRGVGLLFRITEHDGYPRMIIEAMARGKYVIHNRFYEGVWLASDLQTAKQGIIEYVNKKQVNKKGISAMNELKRIDADAQFIKLLSSIRLSKLKRIKAIFFLLKRLAVRRFIDEC